MKKISKFEMMHRDALKSIHGGGAGLRMALSCPSQCRNTPGNGCVRSGCVCLGPVGGSGRCASF